MTFNDQETGLTQEISNGTELTQHMNYTELSSLQQFLSRPTLIHTLTWVSGTPIPYTDVYPWRDFLNNTRIKYKLNNFNFLRGRLHVKAIVSCSPFYYGLLQYAYQPYNGLTNNTTSGANILIPMSQRPCIWVTPQTNEGGEMILPFFYNKDWLDISFANNTIDMGRIHLNEFVPLLSANNVTGEDVTVQLFAWMDDLEMCGPTLNLAMQSDEYSKSPVGDIANSAAAIASNFTELPVIGGFAKATQQVASGVGAVASLFGFSDPPEISNVKAFKNLPFHGLSNADISEPSTKFLLDSKAELSIDPNIVGLDGTDELSVSYIAAKKSYLTQVTWTTADAAGTLKFFSPVTPGYRNRGTALGAGVYPISWTPMGHLSQLFANWKGDITFTVRIIASKYHRGRLLFTWDPAGDLVANSDTINTSFTRILDIGENHEYDITIPYLQARPWLYTEFATSGAAADIYTTGGFTNTLNTERHNGAVSIRIQNVLTAPSGTAPIYILIFVRSNQLELANPVDVPMNYTFFQPQSSFDDSDLMKEFINSIELNKFIVNEIHEGNLLNLKNCKLQADAPKQGEVEEGKLFEDKLDDNIYNVNFGDPVKSVRLLLRRSAMLDVIPFTTTANYNIYKFTIQQTRYPVFGGYNPNSPYVSNSVLGGADTKYYYAFMIPLSWIMPAYVSTRGAIRWHFNALSGTNVNFGHARIFRDVNPSAGGTLSSVGSVGNNVFGPITKFVTDSPSRNGTSGELLINQWTQTGISAEFPYQSMSRMSHSDVRSAWTGVAVDQSNSERFYTELYKFGNNNAITDVVERHVSIGTDFNLHFYLNAPDCWWSPIPNSVS